MDSSIREVTARALALPQRSRALLAEVLLDSLDEPSGGEVEQAWLELAEARDAEMSSGQVTGLDYDEAMARVRKNLRCSA
jgi:putative addiction module component (TIGR02574 family)